MRMLLSIIIMIAAACSISTATHAGSHSGTGISGIGSAVYIDLDIYDVTLPTAGSLDFILDPQGLLSLQPGQSAPLEALIGGRIVHHRDARIINNSSHPVKVTIDFWADSTNGGYDDGAAATFIEFTADDETTIALVEANDANNILLCVVPSASNLPDTAEPFTPASDGYIITTARRSLEFILPAAQYAITSDPSGELSSTPIPGTGSGIALKFGGYVNTSADWSDFRAGPSTISVHTAYTITKADDLAATVDGIPQMLIPIPANALEMN